MLGPGAVYRERPCRSRGPSARHVGGHLPNQAVVFTIDDGFTDQGRIAALDVKRAWASQLPALAAFGTIQQHAHDAPFGTGSGDWTVGVGLTWRPLQALAGVGAVKEAKAHRDAAAARLEAAEEQARLEVSSARRSLDAAAARVAVAAQAVEESRVARDQAALRYRTGSAPITELLDVETAATNAQLNLLGARRDLLVAQAALDFAYGAYDR